MTKPRGFYQDPPTDAQLKTAVIDLDGTLAENIWEPGQAKSFIGEPLDHGVNQLMKLYLEGYRIVIFTSRSWQDQVMIEAWLVAHEIPFNQVICGKPLATIYIDDKAVSAYALSWVPEFI